MVTRHACANPSCVAPRLFDSRFCAAHDRQPLTSLKSFLFDMSFLVLGLGLIVVTLLIIRAAVT